MNNFALIAPYLPAIVVIAVTFVTLQSIYKKKKRLAQAAFFKEFATTHGFSYQEKEDPADNFESNILKETSRDSYHTFLLDITCGMYNNRSTSTYDFFSYPVHVGRYHNPFTPQYTILEIMCGGSIFNIIVTNNNFGTGLGIMRNPFDGTKKIYLDNNKFNKFFNLYIPQEKDIQAQDIFSPDIVETILDKYAMFGFEISDGKLFVISYEIVQSTERLNLMFEFSDFLIANIIPKLGN